MHANLAHIQLCYMRKYVQELPCIIICFRGVGNLLFLSLIGVGTFSPFVLKRSLTTSHTIFQVLILYCRETGKREQNGATMAYAGAMNVSAHPAVASKERDDKYRC